MFHVLSCRADGVYEVGFKCNVLIYYNGVVEWIPPAMFKSSCRMNVKYFPFDKQICDMKFGSWTYENQELRLRFYDGLNVADLNDYVPSATWLITAVPAKITNDTHGDFQYAVMTFQIHLKRTTLLYMVNLVTPCVLLIALTVTVFYMPMERPGKMSFAINLLLALNVVVLLVCRILPPNSITLPLISKYLIFSFIINTASVILTAIVQNWNFRGPTTHSMPRWVKLVFLEKIPRLLRISRDDRPSLLDSSSSIELLREAADKELVDEIFDMHHPDCGHVASRDDEKIDDRDGIVLSSEGLRTASAIEFVAEHLHLEDSILEVQNTEFSI